MEQPVIDEHLVRNYLLGQLAEAERERLEERLLTDDSFYESLTALEDEVEDQLIDQYLDGELTRPEREHFERAFLNTPGRADKLRLIKDLKEHTVAPAPEPASPAVRPPTRRSWMPSFAFFQKPLAGASLAAALVLAVACGVWLWTRSNRLEAELRQAQAQVQPPADDDLRRQLQQLRAGNEELTAALRRSEEQRAGLEQDLASARGREGQTPAPPGKPQPPSPGSIIASVILSPSMRGSSGEEPSSTLTLRPGATQARLTLRVKDVDPADYQGFWVVVKKRGAGEVWRSDGVKVRGNVKQGRAVVTLPAGNLSEGQYVVELDGITPDGQTEPAGIYSLLVSTARP